MRACIAAIAATTVFSLNVPVRAQQPSSQDDGETLVYELSVRIKGNLSRNLPAELSFETESNWGQQARILSIQGITPIHVMRNHGNWQKVKVQVRDVPGKLRVNVGWLSSPAPDRMRFHVDVAMPARADLNQQVWQNGVQVFTQHIHSRCTLAGHFDMEAELLPTSAGLPRQVRLQIVSGRYGCNNLVAENVGGVGGDLARWLDNGAGRTFNAWQPAIVAAFQNQLAPALTHAGDGPHAQTCLCRLVDYTNDVRSKSIYYGSQPTAAPGSVPVAPASMPIHVCTSLEFEVTHITRVGVPELHAVANPVMAHVAEHVAHAALAALLHTHAEHTK